MNIIYGNATDREPQNYVDQNWLKEKKASASPVNLIEK